MNIGNRIRELRTAKGLKIADLAEAVGVDGANISRVETGKQKSFTEQSLSKYAQALGVSVADLFTPGGNKTTVCEYSGSNPHSGDGSVFRVEILDVSASAGGGFIQGSDIIDVIRSIEYNNERALAMFGGRTADQVKVINVRGDSMAETIEPGDLLFVDISIHEFDGDGIYVFGFDDKIYVKRLQMIPDKLLVISDNPRYREWSVDKTNEHRFYIFGKVMISQSQSFKRHA
ncbi:transcriptional regulator [Salmonella enterica]|uniref:Helix-turn-helix transcriptional regulator n=1 Tax=Salmonella enterica subsp. enterica serovar Stanley TaxID=192953 RepID=A0A5X4QNM1_SALET|nr:MULTISPECIES: helix-turn-helix transcriptional regulator [Salmonella]EAT8317112.1 helix-turn-helix transcriptional regulator [Salmonella enterica]EBG7046407.1 helix-turn-helix transcriptional regulator [Salmonella enterica subsp. enterica serovar Stanley]EBS3741201.1 helix-turn-helix transcriptional regulator [Salmonella enterica subsp. enterica serovar Saintpaul]EBV2043961.1 helix-turn-helix transcriptional regulator [Salmonella enterica subsp. enterica serovar Java]EDV6348121.1 helix-turn